MLINISNDGYLGPTAVMRQHLANAVFRAVENGRPVLRVTNTGITAFITPTGEVKDATEGFKPEVRTWTNRRARQADTTFYTQHGDLFVVAFARCLSLVMLVFATLALQDSLRSQSRQRFGGLRINDRDFINSGFKNILRRAAHPRRAAREVSLMLLRAAKS